MKEWRTKLQSSFLLGLFFWIDNEINEYAMNKVNEQLNNNYILCSRLLWDYWMFSWIHCPTGTLSSRLYHPCWLAWLNTPLQIEHYLSMRQFVELDWYCSYASTCGQEFWILGHKHLERYVLHVVRASEVLVFYCLLVIVVWSLFFIRTWSLPGVWKMPGKPEPSSKGLLPSLSS